MTTDKFFPGQVVTVSYVGYYVTANIVGPSDYGHGWWIVEQVYERRNGEDPDYGCQGARYDAAEEFIRPVGEPIAPAPFSSWGHLTWK